MPVSVVVGGQYGSEGKGKVALDRVRRDRTITIVARPGGTNSGHTGYDSQGRAIALRQLPAAAIDGDVTVVLPAGAYIDVALLKEEIAALKLSPDQVVVDPRAQIIGPKHREWELDARLAQTIGSTASGTGASVISRVARFAHTLPRGTQAAEAPELAPFVRDVSPILRMALKNQERILIEGTQGFGLSLLHGNSWPKCTSRDTTAAAMLAETGLSPIDVDEIILVLRCHPIRVAGDSGPLLNETSWQRIAEAAGAPCELAEFTTVTNRLRRVGTFDPEIVKRAIEVNRPTEIVLNHLDYVDWRARTSLTQKAQAFLEWVSDEIGQEISWYGSGPQHLSRVDVAADA